MKKLLRLCAAASVACLLTSAALAQRGGRGNPNGGPGFGGQFGGPPGGQDGFGGPVGGPGDFAPGPGGPGGFGPGGPGGFGPGGGAPGMNGSGAYAPSANTSALQSQLQCTDEEWKVIGPMIDDLVSARQADNPSPDDQGDAFGFGGRGLPQSSDTFGGPNAVPAGGNFRGGAGAFGPLGTVIGNIFSGTPTAQAQTPAPAPSTQPATDPAAPDSTANSGTTGQSITLAQALSDLQNAIGDKSSTPRQLYNLLASVRAARQKANDDLQAAQTQLHQILTPKQEARLVIMGYMD